jgi:Conjugative transposon protein TcpC
VWAVLLIIGYRGVMAIVLNETPSSRSGAPATPAAGANSQFPATLAEAYAMQFGAVYLNFDPATADQRASELAQYVPGNLSSSDPELGWNGSGDLKLQSEQVAGIAVRDAKNAVVTLLANVNGRSMELGVPIYTSGGAMVVSGEPAWLAAPAQAAPPSSGGAPSSDPAAENALMAQLPAFFQAYASGNAATLNRFLAQGASVSGLGGALTYSAISNLYVPPGGDTRHIVVTVVWQLGGQAGAAGGKLEMTYDMTVIDQSGKWFVQAIQASTQGNQQVGGS